MIITKEIAIAGGAGALLLAAAIGSGVTYLVMRRRQDKRMSAFEAQTKAHYQERTSEKVQELYELRTKVAVLEVNLQEATSLLDYQAKQLDAERLEKMESYKDVLKANGYVQVDEEVVEMEELPIPVPEGARAQTGMLRRLPDGTYEILDEIPDDRPPLPTTSVDFTKPHVISEEDFGEPGSPGAFETVDLYYYIENGVVLNEDDEDGSSYLLNLDSDLSVYFTDGDEALVRDPKSGLDLRIMAIHSSYVYEDEH